MTLEAGQRLLSRGKDLRWPRVENEVSPLSRDYCRFGHGVHLSLVATSSCSKSREGASDGRVKAKGIGSELS